jgi:O-methyltransferase involved in polyketide biosynthesis
MSDTPPVDGRGQPIVEIDSSHPQSARIYNYWLGGKDNYPVDRAMGEQIEQLLPGIPEMARHQRAFLIRVVTFLAGEVGIRQFLDIGTGLPTADNTHEVAQRIAPESRIVYVDNDPVVLVHARALLTSSPQGVTQYVDADLRYPDKILAEAGRTLDFTQPVAIMLLGVIHHLTDHEEAAAVVKRLVDAVASGSYLVVTQTTNQVTGAAMDEAVRQWNEASPTPIVIRTPEQIAGFFDGLELLEPGVVSTTQWRPDPAGPSPPPMDEFGAVGRKP